MLPPQKKMGNGFESYRRCVIRRRRLRSVHDDLTCSRVNIVRLMSASDQAAPLDFECEHTHVQAWRFLAYGSFVARIVPDIGVGPVMS